MCVHSFCAAWSVGGFLAKLTFPFSVNFLLNSFTPNIESCGSSSSMKVVILSDRHIITCFGISFISTSLALSFGVLHSQGQNNHSSTSPQFLLPTHSTLHHRSFRPITQATSISVNPFYPNLKYTLPERARITLPITSAGMSQLLDDLMVHFRGTCSERFDQLPAVAMNSTSSHSVTCDVFSSQLLYTDGYDTTRKLRLCFLTHIKMKVRYCIHITYILCRTFLAVCHHLFPSFQDAQKVSLPLIPILLFIDLLICLQKQLNHTCYPISPFISDFLLVHRHRRAHSSHCSRTFLTGQI